MEGKTMKKTYMKPQMLVVKLNMSSLICNSLTKVTVTPDSEMDPDDDFE